MNAPVLVLVLAGVLGAASFLARGRLVMASMIAGLGAGLLGLFTLGVSLDAPLQTLVGDLKVAGSWTFLGRTLALDDGNRASVSFIFLASAFLLTGAWAARPVRYLPSFGLFMTACVAASLMIRPFLYAAPLLEIAAIVGCLLLVGERPVSHRAGIRLLTFYTLAMMGLLLTGWMLESSGVTSATTTEADRVFLLLAVGLAVLLIVPPFHSWLPAAAEGSDPYTLAFVVVILQSSGLFLLLGFLDSYAWLRESIEISQRLRWAGLVTLALGTLWAVGQPKGARFMAYALLADVGVTLLLLSRLQAADYQMALAMAGSRAVGMAVWALGSANEGVATEESRAHAGSRAIPALAASLGALSVVGAPLTAGFPGRWAALVRLGRSDAWAGALIVSSLVVLSVSVLRWNLGSDAQAVADSALTARARRTFLLGGVLLVVALGLFPQLTYPWLVQAARGLENLIP
ncbi:MAG TPA: proton-conducting transporter membrane subunit [Anaerolineales bacterium]|nr:proton-conducting transporter membrane subunit [Anaerolineales bacterium]